jgi:hypothetical protein
LFGFDIEQTAVTSARFALSRAKSDAEGMNIDYHVDVCDFLATERDFVAADIVLMNPPYLSWSDMSDAERARAKRTLGKIYRGRPDKSMLFVLQAIEKAKPNAIVCALLPVGVIAGESANQWRRQLIEVAPPRLVAVLGDHSLFRYATVNVAAVVLDKAMAGRNCATQMVWASERNGAASASLRNLRKSSRGGELMEVMDFSGFKGEQSWSMYMKDVQEFKSRPSWLPAPGLLSTATADRLKTLEYKIGDLFDVRLGIRAGERDVFVLSKDSWLTLPKKERKGFRPIAEKRGIEDGKITSNHYIFVGGESILNEEELKSSYPSYFDQHLLPAMQKLSARLRNEKLWWRLSEARNSWRDNKGPRIVSRQWIRNTGFAVDENGSYVVVQGYAWFPKRKLLDSVNANPRFGDIVDVLKLYCVMLSSDVFYRVAREYSTNAAGGQIDLQQKYINVVPMPLIPDVFGESPLAVQMADRFITDEFPSLRDRNEFASLCYRFDVETY